MWIAHLIMWFLLVVPMGCLLCILVFIHLDLRHLGRVWASGIMFKSKSIWLNYLQLALFCILARVQNRAPGDRCDHPSCGTPILVMFPAGEALSSIIAKGGADEDPSESDGDEKEATQQQSRLLRRSDRVSVPQKRYGWEDGHVSFTFSNRNRRY